MTISPARLAANQANAQKSTGPKTPEGKAKSRLNAFEHGMAGAGDLVGPDEDHDLIAFRTEAFTRELAAPGEVGLLLARRAAVLSVRVERASARELVAVAAGSRAARDEFDADRRATLENWVEALEGRDDLLPALRGLAAMPEGVPHLEAAWQALRSAILAGDPAAASRASLWLGLLGDQPRLDADLVPRIDAELARLGALGPVLEAAEHDIAQARIEAGILASFDPAPEATQARRYEAAAERGMYRALRAIADLRRAQGHGAPTILSPVTEAPPSPARVVAPAPARVPASMPVPVPLASFRAEVAATAPSLDNTFAGLLELPMIPPAPPKKRPDLRKLMAKSR